MNHNGLASIGNLAKATLSFFDEHGRCIPAELKAAAHRNTRRYFAFTQPKVEYSQIYARLKKHLGAPEGLSAKEFEQRAEAALQTLRDDPRTKGITDGVGVPFFIPKATHPDYGRALEDVYLRAVRTSFIEKFSQHSFVNHHKDGLAGKLSIVPGTRHDRLVKAMGQAPVVGYFFPCLTEYAVPAAIEQLANLPDKFLLAGGYDTSAALVSSPDLLVRADGYPPLIWMGALMGEKDQVGYHYEAYGYNLTFNRRPHFGRVGEYWANGLVVLG